MVSDEPDMPGDSQASERPELMSQRLAVVMVAAVFAGSLIESTRRSVRSAVAILRRWLHLT